MKRKNFLGLLVAFSIPKLFIVGGDTVPFETSENDGTEMIMGKEKRPLVSRRCVNNQWFLKNVFNPCLLTFLSAFCFLNYAVSSLKNLP